MPSLRQAKRRDTWDYHCTQPIHKIVSFSLIEITPFRGFLPCRSRVMPQTYSLYGTQQPRRIDPFQYKGNNNRQTRVAKMERNRHKLERLSLNKTRRNSNSSRNSMNSVSSRNSYSSQSIGSLGSVGTRRSVERLTPVIFNNNNYQSAKSFRALPVNLIEFTGINLPEAEEAIITQPVRPSSPSFMEQNFNINRKNNIKGANNKNTVNKVPANLTRKKTWRNYLGLGPKKAGVKSTKSVKSVKHRKNMRV
jgi:hypothetical protein